MAKTDRKTIVKELLADYPDCDVRSCVALPAVTYESVAKNRMLCRTNV